MKKEQHNLAKQKKQAKEQRKESQLHKLFADFGKIYSENHKTK